MGGFTEYSVSVGTHVANLFERTPDVRLNSLMRALALDTNYAEQLSESFINSKMVNATETFLDYAREHNPGGVPTDDILRVVPNKDRMAEFLSELETNSLTPVPETPLEVKVTKTLNQSGNGEVFLNKFLHDEYGYDPYTQRIDDYPAILDPLLDTAYESTVQSYTAALEAKLPELISQIPSSSETRREVTHNDQTMTEVVTTTYSHFSSTSLIPSKNKYAYLGGYDYLGNEDNKYLVSFNVHFIATCESRAIGKAVVEYVAEVTTHYEDAGGNTHDSSSYTEAPVKIQSVSQRFSDDISESFGITHTPEFNPRDRFYYAEYVVIYPDGTQDGKIIVIDSESVQGIAFTTYRAGSRYYDSNKYMPLIRLRTENTDLLSDKTSDYYNYTRRQFDTIGLDVDDLVNTVNESDEIDDLDEAYFFMGFDIQTENEGSKHYLAEFFHYVANEHVRLEDDSVIEEGGDDLIIPPVTTPTDPIPPNKIRIAQDGFKNEIQYTGISTSLFEGKIGPKPSDTCTIEIRPTNNSSKVYLLIRKQLDADTYREIRVYGLKHFSWVYQKHSVVTSLEDVYDDPTNNKFLIPYSQNIMYEISSLHRNNAVSDSFKLVFHAYKKTKLKWYQTSAFNVLVTIAAVAIAIYAGWEAGKEFYALLTTKGALAAAQFVAIELVKGVAINVIFEYAVQKLGEEFAMIVAAALILYGGADKLLSNGAGIGSLTADMMLKVSLNISNATSRVLEEKADDLRKEMEDYLEEQQERALLIEETKEQLYGTKLLSPYASLPTSPILSFNESPSRFLERTGTISNPGVDSIGAIGSYVEYTLNKGRIKGY